MEAQREATADVEHGLNAGAGGDDIVLTATAREGAVAVIAKGGMLDGNSTTTDKVSAPPFAPSKLAISKRPHWIHGEAVEGKVSIWLARLLQNRVLNSMNAEVVFKGNAEAFIESVAYSQQKIEAGIGNAIGRGSRRCRSAQTKFHSRVVSPCSSLFGSSDCVQRGGMQNNQREEESESLL